MTVVIAHRGASRDEPENTVEAFRRAVVLGAEGIELDVRRTADEALVVHHDARLADGRIIRDTPVAELPAHVPTLARALDSCAGALVNVEIKNDPGDPDFDPGEEVALRTAELLAARGQPLRWLVSSFRIEAVDACRRTAPAIRTALLSVAFDDGEISRAVDAGHVAIHPWVGNVTADLVVRAHGVGLAVNVWTCDDPDRMRELIAWGVDGICTNVPDVALAVRRSILG